MRAGLVYLVIAFGSDCLFHHGVGWKSTSASSGDKIFGMALCPTAAWLRRCFRHRDGRADGTGNGKNRMIFGTLEKIWKILKRSEYDRVDTTAFAEGKISRPDWEHLDRHFPGKFGGRAPFLWRGNIAHFRAGCDPGNSLYRLFLPPLPSHGAGCRAAA
jgi:hypothetical protein